jgi:CBS-domain-containing membrane protein
MHFTRTVHPPGGATARITVIGTEPIKNIGYWYVRNPVLFGAILLRLIAWVANNLSANPRRHYPAYWF